MVPDIRITINGMYENDPSIFDEFVLCDELEPYRDTIINSILFKSLPVECVYPEPEFLKHALCTYSKLKQEEWKRLYKACTMDYDPLHDRQGTIKENEKINDDGTGTNTTTMNSTGTSELQTSTFEGGGYNNRNRTTDNDNSHANGESTNKNERNRGLVQEISLSSGMRSVQEILQKELNLVPQLNFIDIISTDIVERFCVMVY